LQPHSEIQVSYHPNDLEQRFGGTFLALVFLIVTIFLMVGVASIPWLDYSESSTTYYLGGFCDHNGCHAYTDREEPFRTVFPLTYILVLTALALSVFELGFLVLSMFWRWKWSGAGVLITGILGSIALPVAAIYLYFGLLMTFWSPTSAPPTAPWGVGAGLVMAFVVAVLFLVATIVAFFAARHIKPRGNVQLSSS